MWYYKMIRVCLIKVVVFVSYWDMLKYLVWVSLMNIYVILKSWLKWCILKKVKWKLLRLWLWWFWRKMVCSCLFLVYCVIGWMIGFGSVIWFVFLIRYVLSLFGWSRLIWFCRKWKVVWWKLVRFLNWIKLNLLCVVKRFVSNLMMYCIRKNLVIVFGMNVVMNLISRFLFCGLM